ncbi:MAG: hypothetical protein HC905_10470 [Bacteroidales bacterium]|nr:hypothetical protein [Bacteroidales bacterium]
MSAIISDFKIFLGYWYGHQFISYKGEPLLMSVSYTDPMVSYPKRYVLNLKSSYQKQIFKHISFRAYIESYYDIKLGQFDYAYGIDMSISGDFLFKGRK